MKLQSFHPPLGIRSGASIQNKAGLPSQTKPADGFQPSSAPPPLWKKALNSAVVSLGGAAAAATIVTAAVAAGQGAGALGAAMVGVAVGGPIGLVAGAIAGWKNCGAEKASLGRKLVNASAWAVAGAGAGAIATVAVAASGMSGPDALAAFSFAKSGAVLGAAGAALAGWNLVGG